MSSALDSPSSPPADEMVPYRALCSSAVIALVLGVLSTLALFNWYFALIPAAALAVGLRAMWQIRRQSDELSGMGLARTGVALAVVLWPAGWALLGYQYLTEVPAGYARVSYEQLQPDPRAPDQPVPPSAVALDGQRIFIKGYVYPGPIDRGITRFLLVRDNGTCCFGGSKPRLNDMIEVTLVGGLKLNYSPNLHRLAGTFRVAPQVAANPDLGLVLYHLEADYVK